MKWHKPRPQAKKHKWRPQVKKSRATLPTHIRAHTAGLWADWGEGGVQVMAQGTLREILTKVKAPRPQKLQKGVVYKIPCKDCEKVYIGETGRNQKRLVEHKAAVRRWDTKNGIAVHAWE